MGIPSRAAWWRALRRAAGLAGIVAACIGAQEGARRVADWLELAYGWHDPHSPMWSALRPIDLAAFFGVILGLVWTVGALVVESMPVAQRAFRSLHGVIARAARAHTVVTTRLAPWVPGVVAAVLATGRSHLAVFAHAGHWVGVATVMLASHALFRRPLARLLDAPLEPVSPVVEEAPLARGASDSHFSAVAVTRATRAIVAGAVASTAAMMLVALFVQTTWLLHQGGLSLLAAYIAVMFTATIWLRRSRILVGIDGVLVLGVGTPRFHAYAEHDEVRQDGEDIVLLRQGRARVRLQLDEIDRKRAPKLVERLRAAMSLAAQMGRDGVDHPVRSLAQAGGASRALASSARGAVDYRKPAVVREQLWALVEGPLCDGETRIVAAEALVHDLREEERTRLRVAATACAEPRVRVALERLAPPAEDAEDAEEEEGEPAAPEVARSQGARG